MDKRMWLNLSLTALVVVLALFIYLQRDTAQAPPVTRLTGLPAADVDEITLSRPTEADIVLRRDGASWRMVEPLRVPANQQRVEALLAILSQPSYGRFPVDTMQLSELGLAPPRVSLRFNTTRIDFGGTEALNKRRYVRLGDQVQLIDDDNYYSIIAQRDHYISLRLLNGDPQLVRIKLPGLQLHKDENGWQLDTRQTPKLGDDTMRLVQTWQSASALEVHPGDPARARGRPVIELGLEGGQPPIRLAILSRQPDLLLLRLDNHLLYTFTAHQARQMLLLSPETD